VAPVTEGVREVFVVEWWVGEECADTLQPRGEDSLRGIRHALALDPNSGFLHRSLGEKLCEQLPCAALAADSVGRDAAVAAEAEAAYRKAAALSPDDASTIHGLGRFLIGSEMFAARAEGVMHLRSAHALDPTVVSSIPQAYLALEEPPFLCREWARPQLCDSMPVALVEKLVRMVCAAAALGVVGPLWLLLERQQKPAGGSRRRRSP
jgi:hypothetical protein